MAVLADIYKSPIAGGIIRLSKSERGRISINIAQSATQREIKQSPQQQKVEIKTAKKQVRLPAAVFPWAPGIVIFPKSFPIRLARPSPKASAKIPTRAQSSGSRSAASRMPHTRVTGPSTKWFSSRFLAAISVIFFSTSHLLSSNQSLVLESNRFHQIWIFVIFQFSSFDNILCSSIVVKIVLLACNANCFSSDFSELRNSFIVFPSILCFEICSL